jgi:hypothetical protein
VEELLNSFIVALDAVIQDEETSSAQVSPEEWDDISPSKRSRRASLLYQLNVSVPEVIAVPETKELPDTKQCYLIQNSVT